MSARSAVVVAPVRAICAVVVAALLAGCGGSDSSGSDGSDSSAPVVSAVDTTASGATVPAAVDETTVVTTTAPSDALEPLVCEHTGSGTEYAVGPDQPYASIGEVPWAGLVAGDTVRIFWRDEPYREKFLIQGLGTEDAPIVVCGVAGLNGELPVIDGENATASPDMGYATTEGQGRGLIHVSYGDDDEWGDKPAYVVIQGLHIRNAYYSYDYTGSDGAAAPYFENAAGIFVERGDHITVRGVELESNGNGFFVASGDTEEVRSHDIVLERSYIHDNGTPEVGQDQRHNIYTEADGMVFQYNEIGPLAAGSLGAALKDRSTGTVVRYNRITGGTRSLDLVDAEDSNPLARDDPDYRTTLVYGNVIINDAAVHGAILSNMFHYGGDSGVTDGYRKGVLYFVHNTVVVRADQDGAAEISQYQTSLFDLDTEDERAVIANNVFHVRSVTPDAVPTDLAWGRGAGTIELGVNWASPATTDWRYPDETTGTVGGTENVLTNDANDPLFVDESGGDLAPAEGSPLVDAAAAVPEEFGALGLVVNEEYAGGSSSRARPDDGAPDLGAYESAGAPQVTPSSGTPATGDSQPATSEAPDTGASPVATPASGEFALPDDAPALAGKGPQEADNGDAFPCGSDVLCVGGSGTYDSINDAIAVAAAGDVIQVAAGTYTENVVLGSFTALDTRNLTLLGGFSADFSTRDAAANRSVIDGGGDDPAVQLHVLSDESTMLDGFVLTGGVGLGTDYSDGGGSGGGVHAQQQGDGELVISHNEIYGNRTRAFDDDAARGGGIHADAVDWDGSAPTVRIEHNFVHDNEAARGGGIEVRGRASVIANNRVLRNLGHSDHGGGVYLSAGDNEVTDNIVSGNEVGVTVGYGWGGGILIAAVPATLAGNVVTDNYAPTIGSGVFWDEGAVGTMTGDLIAANRCPTDGRSGAGIYVDGGEPGPSHVTAERITVVGHLCPDLPDGGAIMLEGGSSITITASILWANGIDVVTTASDDEFTIDDSTTSDGDDPQFVDPAGGDYSLQDGSPSAGRGAFA